MEIQTLTLVTYKRLFRSFGVRPSIELVADTLRYPYELIAEQLLELAIDNLLFYQNVDESYTSPTPEQELVKLVINRCDSQQLIPTLAIVRDVCPGTSVVMRKAILAYLNREYKPVSKECKTILRVYKSYTPSPLVKDAPRTPTIAQLCNLTGLTFDHVTQCLTTLTEKGLLSV